MTTKTQNSIHPVAESFNGQPLLIDSGSVDLVSASLNHLIHSEHAEKVLGEVSAFVPESDDEFWDDEGFAVRYGLRPYVIQNGTLLVPVQGVLLNHFSYSFGRWATGYQYIERAVARGMADENVKRVALIVNSGGGIVNGCFECAEAIADFRGQKPIHAFAEDYAYSAAYAIACAADEITVSRSGATGSVGVLTAHVDMSEMLKNVGIKITHIFAGKHKVDGNSTEPLPDSVKARIQERIDRSYAVFVNHVAVHRGMEEAEVRKTEAATYEADESVEVGFADNVGSIQSELAAFAGEGTTQEEDQMTTKTNGTSQSAAPEGATLTQADVDAARADGVAQGTAAERTRVTAILGSDEAAARPSAALMMVDLGVDAEKAATNLSKLPEEKSAASKDGESVPQTLSAFEQAMQNTPNPGVGSTEGQEQDAPQMSVSDGIFESAGYGKPN